MRAAEADEDRTAARVPAALTRSGFGSDTDRPSILKARPRSRLRVIDTPTQQAMARRMTSIAKPFGSGVG